MSISPFPFPPLQRHIVVLLHSFLYLSSGAVTLFGTSGTWDSLEQGIGTSPSSSSISVNNPPVSTGRTMPRRRQRNDVCPRGERAALAVALLVASLATGCAPMVRGFAVLPHHVCLGTVVAASWDAEGCPSIATVPALAPQGPGDRTFLPVTDTVFTLTVERWPYDPRVSQTEVTVAELAAPDRETEDELPFQVRCEDGRLQGAVDRPSDAWDSRLIVTRLTTDSSREITIVHEDRAHVFTVAEPETAAFAGTALGGRWALSAPLLRGERCGDPAASPPDLIVVTAGISCTR